MKGADYLDIKIREIRMEKMHEENALLLDEYGLENGGIYHRFITIEEQICEDFAKDPDEEMLLNTFLERHHIPAEWKRYEWEIPIEENIEDETEQFSRLQDILNLDVPLDKSPESKKLIKKRMEEKIHVELSDYETLIENPFVINVFNEAIKQNSELSSWENVFPFFR